MCPWRVGEHPDPWLQKVVVHQKICIHAVCKLAFRIHDGHSLACNAVTTSLHGRLLLPAMCVCGLLSVHGGLAFTFCHWCQMGSRRWIAGGTVLVALY